MGPYTERDRRMCQWTLHSCWRKCWGTTRSSPPEENCPCGRNIGIWGDTAMGLSQSKTLKNCCIHSFTFPYDHWTMCKQYIVKTWETCLTLVPSSGIFVHFSWTFFLMVISAVLQLLAWIFARSLLLSQIFEIQCRLLLHVLYTLVMHFAPSGHLRGKNVHAPKNCY